MDTLRELRKSTGAALCVECGKCSTLCPLAAFGHFSAARTMSMHDPASEMHEYADAVEKCLTCGACETRCPQGVRYTEFVRGLRQILPNEHRHPCPHGEIFQLAGRSMAQGEGSRHREWLDDDLVVAEEGEIALFVGCLPLFDIVFGDQLQVEAVESARAAVRLLNRLGIEPVILDQERCCGHDLLWGGEREAFAALARANCECFRQRGIRQILTVCAECCRTWRLDYPEVVADYRPRVEHLVEFLAALLQEEAVEFRSPTRGTVTYQDPCRLGRQLDVLDQPRELIASVQGVELVEMTASGRDARCCGTTGFVHCDATSRQLQAKRLRSAADTGADWLLTACPKCLLHFHCAQSEDRRRGRASPELRIEDLTVYLADRMAEVGESPLPPSDTVPPRGGQS